MELRFGVTGEERKRLVRAIRDAVGISPAYQRAPSFAYVIGGLCVDCA